jgi:hypothetical protein
VFNPQAASKGEFPMPDVEEARMQSLPEAGTPGPSPTQAYFNPSFPVAAFGQGQPAEKVSLRGHQRVVRL